MERAGITSNSSNNNINKPLFGKKNPAARFANALIPASGQHRFLQPLAPPPVTAATPIDATALPRGAPRAAVVAVAVAAVAVAAADVVAPTIRE